MLLRTFLVCVLILVFHTLARAGNCISHETAHSHIGESKCVSGKVMKVEARNGVHFLDFCDDYRLCTFTALVFARDLRHVGDVRQLSGKTVQLQGDIVEYDGRAEIIISRPEQLRGEAARIPPLPKGFDVADRGHYSAGKFSHPGSSSTAKRKRASTVSSMQGMADAQQD